MSGEDDGDLMTTTHYRPISIFDMREGAQKTEIDDRIA